MTEHSKIPVPGQDPEKDERSLLERATGAFGLDGFKAAPVPQALRDEAMKRAKVRKSAPEPAHEPEPEVQAASEPREEQEAPATEAQLPVAVPPPPSELTVVQDRAVSFRGESNHVDREHLRDRGMIVPEGSVSEVMEEFRIVKRQLIATARERGTAASRRVLISSPLPGEGKTFCSTNLALSMASERDTEVLLVDADFAKPSILSTLGLPKGPGLMDALANPDLKVEELVMGTDVPGLWVLPAGNQTASDSEYLSSSRTGEVLDRLTVGAPNRIVIFDTPPALAASPAAELAKHVGQAVLVARANKTGQSALEDAYQLLSACPDIKLLLNAALFSPSGRRFGSYYGYEG